LQPSCARENKQGGSFGYTAVLAKSAAGLNRAVKIARVLARPDPAKVRQFADDVRDGKFVLPIGRRMPLHDAAEAHVLREKSGIGKIFLLNKRQCYDTSAHFLPPPLLPV
jgi:NADPH:quinone reductase-like Zn-dependent oxidoreductase